MPEQGAGNLAWEFELCSDCGVEFAGKSCWCGKLLPSVEYDLGEPVGGIAICNTNFNQFGVFCS